MLACTNSGFRHLNSPEFLLRTLLTPLTHSQGCTLTCLHARADTDKLQPVRTVVFTTAASQKPTPVRIRIACMSHIHRTSTCASTFHLLVFA